jgi:hypothetical protein
MDIVREKNPRLIWIHKDETESQFQKSQYQSNSANPISAEDDLLVQQLMERPCV